MIVVERSGKEVSIDARDGVTVMEAIRDSGVYELLALCGGCCSCATCHIIVDTDWLAHVGPASGDEDDLLDSSDHRTAGSRLSCQIPLTASLDGLRVTIAPED